MEPWTQSSEGRFVEYVDALATVLGRADRAGPLKDYCIGLLMPGERKSVEPMAAIVAPARVSAKHQSLLHLVSQAAWSDEAVLAKVRELVLPTIEAQGKIEAWIVDDTGFAKKGVHSVGVARQYCGRLGKTDNCQIAVTLSIANHAASLPIAYELYLPEDWAVDAARRKKARVPDDDQTGDRPRSDPNRASGRRRSGRLAGRRRVWRRRCVPRRRHGQRFELYGRRAVDAERLASRRRTAAAQTLERAGPAAIAHAPRRRTCPCSRQDSGEGASRGGLAHRSMAGGL